MACPNPTVMAADLLVPMSLPQPIDPYLNMLTTPGSKAFGVCGGVVCVHGLVCVHDLVGKRKWNMKESSKNRPVLGETPWLLLFKMLHESGQ